PRFVSSSTNHAGFKSAIVSLLICASGEKRCSLVVPPWTGQPAWTAAEAGPSGLDANGSGERPSQDAQISAEAAQAIARFIGPPLFRRRYHTAHQRWNCETSY